MRLFGIVPYSCFVVSFPFVENLYNDPAAALFTLVGSAASVITSIIMIIVVHLFIMFFFFWGRGR